MENYINQEKLINIHMQKVVKAIEKNRLYFVCIEGCEHKVNSIKEYIFLTNKDYVYQFYGI